MGSRDVWGGKWWWGGSEERILVIECSGPDYARRVLQYQYLTDLPRSNRTWHESPFDTNAFPNQLMSVLPNCSRYGYFPNFP